MASTTVPVRFVKKDIESIDHFIEEGFFTTKSDLIRMSVRHYIRELAFEELMKKASNRPLTKEDVDRVNRRIKEIRRERWEKGTEKYGY